MFNPWHWRLWDLHIQILEDGTELDVEGGKKTASKYQLLIAWIWGELGFVPANSLNYQPLLVPWVWGFVPALSGGLILGAWSFLSVEIPPSHVGRIIWDGPGCVCPTFPGGAGSEGLECAAGWGDWDPDRKRGFLNPK